MSFTPVLAPMPRGILATCTARLSRADTGTAELRAALAAAYPGSGFACLLPEGRWPATASVAGSNGAHLQAAADSRAGRAVVVAAIDNLGKGAGRPGHPERQPDARPARGGRPDRERSRAMSVTDPRGFRAAGVAAGIKASGSPDVAVVLNDGPSAAAAGVFTSNRVKAAPVLWSQQVLAGGRVRAVVLNSGGANACTGPAGFADTHHTAEHLAALLSATAAGAAADGRDGAGHDGGRGRGEARGEARRTRRAPQRWARARSRSARPG